MLLLVPGRHHLLTRFQHDYLSMLCAEGIESAECVHCNDPSLEQIGSIDGVVFAITSSNHFGTRRNPIPFYLRALAVHDFGKSLPVPTHIYGVNDVGLIDDFAAFTIKTIDHDSSGRFDLSPANTVIVCSTPVAEGYLEEGYRVATAERGSCTTYDFAEPLPWVWVERIPVCDDGLDSRDVQEAVHPASLRVWCDYELDHYTREVFDDPLVGDDGDLTETRDYLSYVRKMDEIAELKFLDTAPFLRPGRVGDIGCAVGSWIKLASEHSPLNESDFYGVEVARPLYEICVQRKINGEFSSPSVFFKRKNAVRGRCFKPNSMDTIHTGSITHEIESYGSRDALLTFIEHRFAELRPGGAWVNRDVIGPENGDREVLLWLDDQDGKELDETESPEQADRGAWLDTLSTYARFLQFAIDFRKEESDPIQYEIAEVQGRRRIRIPLRDAAEYLLTKDYTQNWDSEMHERFCFWSFDDWVDHLSSAGFRIHPQSKAYQNPWIVENRWSGRAEIHDAETMTPIELPPTNVLLVAVKG